jgi:ornithine cyclodeaminase/alanine dehydrogenase-like protein (mu-crystallin family)
MPEIFNREQIERALQRVDVMTAIEEGFVAYSRGKVVVPPVGELVFDDPPGDVHSKYGYIKNDDTQITVADLTGVAVQDIQISKAVYEVLSEDPV